MKTKEKIYRGDIYVTKENSKEWETKLQNVTKITGYIIAYQGASITIPSPVLAQTGDIMIDSDLCDSLLSMLLKKFKNNKWYITESSPSKLIKSNLKNVVYKLSNVRFSREWFLKIKNDTLTPDEVFAIDNIEHRRIAYQFMDKSKMKQFKDFTILDEVKDDGHGHPMKIVSFTVQNMKEPLLFYNCFCPSTGREYFVGTDKKTCDEAKFSSFGLHPETYEFVNEW